MKSIFVLAVAFLGSVQGLAVPQAVGEVGSTTSGDPRAGDVVTNPERNNSSPTMQVTGQGSVDIATNLVRIDATVSQNLLCQNKPLDQCDAGKLQKDVNKKLNDIMDLQNTMTGIESIQTQGLNLATKYDYVNNTEVFKGYTSSVSLVAIVNNNVFGDVLNEMLKKGVKSIDSTAYYISYKERNDARIKCLQIATENAMQQADTILGALDKSRSDIKTIAIPYVSDPFVANQVTPGISIDPNSPVTNGLLTVAYSVKMRVGY